MHNNSLFSAEGKRLVLNCSTVWTVCLILGMYCYNWTVGYMLLLHRMLLLVLSNFSSCCGCLKWNGVLSCWFMSCHHDMRSTKLVDLTLEHEDIIKGKHFPRYWPFVWGIHQSPVNSPHKGQWRGALMFSLIWAWINGSVDNRDAGDLRCHHAHDDVTVMEVTQDFCEVLWELHCEWCYLVEKINQNQQ